jgi:hypothetical protein
MKRVLAIVLGLCLLSGLSVNADIDTIEGSTIAGGRRVTLLIHRIMFSGQKRHL